MEPLIGGRGDGRQPGVPPRRSVPPIALALGVVVVGVIGIGLVRSRTTEGDGLPRLQITSAVVSEGSDEAAGYLVIDNQGGADQLIATDADVAGRVTVHRTVAAGGAETMEEQPSVRVPKGVTRLAPGETHLMLEQLHDPLVPGATVTLTLSFSRSGPLTVSATVQSYSDIAASLERSAP